jgi:hypothetical protein
MKIITLEELRGRPCTEGLILQGCGGDLNEWVTGINEMLTEEGILLDGDTFKDVSSFEHDGVTNLLFSMDNVKLDVGRLAMWRLQSHDTFGGKWLSDYLPNRLGVEHDRTQESQKSDDGRTFYTLDKMLEMMEPQHQRDQALIRDCISGLTVYAAQHAQSDPDSPKIPEMRKLAEELAGYWGLDDGLAETIHRDFLQPFDESIEAAKNGAVVEDGSRHSASVIYGLYRYGEEMASSGEAVYKDDIQSMSNLMKEIASAWDFESHTLDDLTAQLEVEVQTLNDAPQENGFVMEEMT